VSRSAADIGRGLRPARQARPIWAGERIHVLGAGGAGASGAALLAHAAGAAVTGCDTGGPSPYTAALEAAGISLAWTHDPAHIYGADGRPVNRLAVTKALTAVTPEHPELLAAAEQGVATEPWQQVIADVAASTGQRLVAVAGTHGKSTTSGWLVHLLVTAGRDPSAFVGALLDGAVTGGPAATSRRGSGDAFVVEADEYAGNFDPYRPEVVLLLNAEWDHPDVFPDEEAVLAAFEDWLRRAAEDGRRPVLVANVGDSGVRQLVDRLTDWPGWLVAVTLEPEPGNVWRTALGRATLLAASVTADGPTSRLQFRRPDGTRVDLGLGLPGRHNAANALAILGAAHVLAVPDIAVSRSLATFGGVGRRLELKGDVGGVVVLDDYAHHPTAIARTLEAVRQRYPERRVWAVYEPLTYHRTAVMLERFADILAQADVVAIADIWAGRDPDTTVTSSAALAEAVTRRGGASAVASGSVEATADHLAQRVLPGDVVLVMGGGRSYVIAERLAGMLAAVAGESPSGGDR
jgi:UDP-N-acetylmuramate--alanine ligase